MKRFDLTSLIAAATLFLAADLVAQETMSPGSSAPATRAVASQPGNSNSAPARATARSAELLKRYDKNGDGRIDDDERVAAKDEMLNQNLDRQMARMSAAQLTPEQFRARLREFFDRNKDGQLDDEERAAAQRFVEERGGASGASPAPWREELVRRFDKNKNGRIDAAERAELAEFLRETTATARAETKSESESHSSATPPAKDAGRTSPRSATGPFGGEMLKRFDADGDGRLDPTELAAAEAAMRNRMSANPQFLRRWDKNADGKIDDEEWSVARAELRRGGRGRDPK